MARENKSPRRQEEKDGLCKKLICVNRVTKVVKGGRKMRFAALHANILFVIYRISLHNLTVVL